MKKYTLKMEFEIEEPKDYEDFKWRFLRAVYSCVDGAMIVQSVCLTPGYEDGLAIRSSTGEFALQNCNRIN